MPLASRYNMSMNTKHTLEKIAARSVSIAWDKLTAVYGRKALGDKPRIVINRRLKSTAGRAWLQDGVIDISERLMLDFPREIIMQTIPHEVAHIAALRVYNYGLKRGESHGAPWVSMMQALGLDPAIYHTMLEQRAVKLTLKDA